MQNATHSLLWKVTPGLWPEARVAVGLTQLWSVSVMNHASIFDSGPGGLMSDSFGDQRKKQGAGLAGRGDFQNSSDIAPGPDPSPNTSALGHHDGTINTVWSNAPWRQARLVSEQKAA